jgi:Protein of unknown function (DUF2393)
VSELLKVEFRTMSPAPIAPSDNLFSSRPPERQPINYVPWVIAGVVVLLGIVLLAVVGHHKTGSPPNAVLPLDPYAPSLVFSGLQMSESTSLSGGKSTYIDGHVKNAGTKTVTGATVQVLFANDVAMPPQVETVPVALIRTHEPYIDTQPIADAPLAPGDEKEFRLIFENVAANWNQQLPEVRVVKVASR